MFTASLPCVKSDREIKLTLARERDVCRWSPFYVGISLWKRNGSDVTMVRFQRKSAMTGVDNFVMETTPLFTFRFANDLYPHPWLISWNADSEDSFFVSKPT